MDRKNRCLDCRWCRVSTDPKHDQLFECEYTREPLTIAMVWRRACKDFVPVHELPQERR